MGWGGSFVPVACGREVKSNNDRDDGFLFHKLMMQRKMEDHSLSMLGNNSFSPQATHSSSHVRTTQSI